jgi:hypothetical protein
MLTQSSMAAESMSSSRPSRAIAVSPQYRPLIQKCSVATSSSFSAPCCCWWVVGGGWVAARVQQRLLLTHSVLHRSSCGAKGGERAARHLPDTGEGGDVGRVLVYQQLRAGPQLSRRQGVPHFLLQMIWRSSDAPTPPQVCVCVCWTGGLG